MKIDSILEKSSKLDELEVSEYLGDFGEFDHFPSPPSSNTKKYISDFLLNNLGELILNLQSPKRKSQKES